MAPLDLRLGRRMQPTTRGRYLSVRGLLSDASSGVNVGFQKNEMEVFVMRWMELECVGTYFFIHLNEQREGYRMMIPGCES